MAQSTLVVRVDEGLKTAFADAAKAADRTASQLLRDYMREFVRESAAGEHDAWFRQQVSLGLSDARAGRVRSSKDVESHFAERRRKTRARLAGNSGGA